MFNGILHKVVLACGFIIALISFAWNYHFYNDLLHAAFVALCVLFAVSTVLLIAMQAIARVLYDHLKAEKEKQLAEEAAAKEAEIAEQKRIEEENEHKAREAIGV
jgi:predicted Holliday junction resolvase-like endonuclease